MNGSIAIADAGRFTLRRTPLALLVAIHIPGSLLNNPGVGRNHKKDTGRAIDESYDVRSTTAHRWSSPLGHTAPC